MNIERSPGVPQDMLPATSAHKMIGTLNLIFASVLLLVGACCGVSVMGQVAMAPINDNFQKSMQEGINAQAKIERQKKIDELQAQEEAAATEADKEDLAAKRKLLEQQPLRQAPVVEMMAPYRSPKLIGYMVADLSTSLALNLLLFISGIGLLGAKSWGRRMGIWVAALKIIRLVLVYGFALFFVVPELSQKMGEMMEKMTAQVAQQQPGQPQMPQVGQTVGTVYGVMMSSGAVLMIIFGPIYPIVMLRVLTRPKVKLACGETLDGYPAAPL
ncbi:MAG TPA: hypothetical protein VGJ26_16760 [Pirellulales bacterium]|jgi:hypothetical protein